MTAVDEHVDEASTMVLSSIDIPDFLKGFGYGRPPCRHDAADLRKCADLWADGLVIADQQTALEVAELVREAADWVEQNTDPACICAASLVAP